MSQVAITMFSTSNTFILGLFCDAKHVGYFAVADRFIRAVVSLIQPISNAIFPKIAKNIDKSPNETFLFLKKLLLYGSTILLIICIVVFFNSSNIAILLTGGMGEQVSMLIRILAIIPLLIFINNILGTQIMLNCNMGVQFMYVMIVTGLFSVISSVAVVPYLGGIGTAVVSLLSEVLVVALMIYYVSKSKYNILVKFS
jgi:PST family polysaccharide transporter